MARRTLILALALVAATAALGAAGARDMYNAALARERAVRSAMLAEDAPPTVVTDVRSVVADYQAIVKRYPASGYSDDALWQGGRLSLDAFLQFGQAREKTTATRMLRLLVASYPTSKLVKQVPEQLERLEATDNAAAPAASAAAGTSQPAATGPSTTPAATAPASSASASGAPKANAAGGPLATIRDIRRALLPDVVRVIVELDAETTFHQEHLGNPARVFVDFASTRASSSLVDQTLRFEGDGDLVTKIRTGRHPNHTTRVVIDTEGVASYSIYPLYDPFRLVIDCLRPPVSGLIPPPSVVPFAQPPVPAVTTRPAPAVSRASPIVADTVAPASITRLPSNDEVPKTIEAPPPSPPSPPAALTASASSASTSPPSSAPTPSPSTANPPWKNSGGGFSIARQLGLGVSRIVIDPGHGGHDPGAQGKNVNEAEVVLDIALRLEKLLLKTPGTDVILTRRTDDFVPLPERTAIANREGADLFLSIHANANPSEQARGVETYFLNFANNLSAAAVAARENDASGQAMGALPDFVKAIALNNKLDESRDLAAHVQRAMVERLKGSNKSVKNLGVKQAPFVVLIGAAMPSVLVEISFLTNAQEAKLLRGGAYRQKIAEALFNAIRKYQTSLINTKTVAQRGATQ